MESERFVTLVTLVTRNGVLEPVDKNSNNTLCTPVETVTPVTPVTVDRCLGCGVWLLLNGDNSDYCEYCLND